MSVRQLCPGCEAQTSSVRAAFERDAPCPSCGLPAGVAAQVLEVRARRGDEQLRRELEQALIRADRAERERNALLMRLRRVQVAVQEERVSGPTPAHGWQEFNEQGNTCHWPGCGLTEEQHAAAGWSAAAGDPARVGG